MINLETGDKAPDFSLPNSNGDNVSLSDYKGQNIILYFYPRDNTPGCTTEANEFSNLIEEFEKLNAKVIGISTDSTKSHLKFKNKHSLKVTLLSDIEHGVIEKYGSWQKKKMAGKEYYGIVRSTFLINEQGNIEKIWPKVKAKGHAQEVLNTIKN